MARGSSYGGKSPELSRGVTTPTNIPRRATRTLQAMSIEEIEQEQETQHSRSSRNRRAPQASSTLVTREIPLYEEDEEPRTTRIKSTPRTKTRVIVPEYPEEAPHPLRRHHSWLKIMLVSLGCTIVGAIVLTIAGMYLRAPSTTSMVNYQGQSFPVQLGGSYDAFTTWYDSSGPIPTRTAIPKNPGPYSVLGKPTITVDLINQVLAHYNSPTAGMGKDLYNLGVKYGIDPVYPLAFFMHESLFGTTGEARVTRSLGNLRCIEDRPCIDRDRGGYAQMYSWQDGFEQWYKLIRNLYVSQWGRVTVDQIIPKYAPNSDGNNEKAYIALLKHEVDTWRAGGLTP
ncbi:MAG TPA: hypothetical protein VFN35_32645 [Ktedonobacteraceae bacterium]|nr:hypothetical protein [Ktedonobacteraceae bacterium]